MFRILRSLRIRFFKNEQIFKYLVYAFGEIILVVLGILIALQVNTWNESKKLANREAFVLGKLMEEFQADSTRLDRYIFLTDMKAERGRSIMKMVQRETELDTSFLITHAFFNGRVLIFGGFTPTFDELIASGNLSIIQNQKMVDKIKFFKNNLKTDNTFRNEESLRRKEAYNNHLYRYFEVETMTYLWENSGDVKGDELMKYRSDIKGFLADPETLYYINIQIGTDAEMHWIYKERRMEQLSEILELIRFEITKKTS